MNTLHAVPVLSRSLAVVFLGIFVAVFIPINFFIKEERQISAEATEGYTNTAPDKFVNSNSADAATPLAISDGSNPQPAPAALMTETDGAAPASESDSAALLSGVGEDGTAPPPAAHPPVFQSMNVSFKEQITILFKQMREPTIACFILWTFLSNLGEFV